MVNCKHVNKSKKEVESDLEKLSCDSFEDKWGMSKKDAEKCLNKLKDNNRSSLGITENKEAQPDDSESSLILTDEDVEDLQAINSGLSM